MAQTTRGMLRQAAQGAIRPLFDAERLFNDALDGLINRCAWPNC